MEQMCRCGVWVWVSFQPPRPSHSSMQVPTGFARVHVWAMEVDAVVKWIETEAEEDMLAKEDRRKERKEREAGLTAAERRRRRAKEAAETEREEVEERARRIKEKEAASDAAAAERRAARQERVAPIRHVSLLLDASRQEKETTHPRSVTNHLGDSILGEGKVDV